MCIMYTVGSMPLKLLDSPRDELEVYFSEGYTYRYNILNFYDKHRPTMYRVGTLQTLWSLINVFKKKTF